MDKEFDRSLRELLGNHTEQPSLDCWDRVLSRLDVVQAVNTASRFSQFVGSVAGKAAIAVAVAVGVGTAVYFAAKDEAEQTVPQQEVVAAEQDTGSLYREYVKEDVVENEAERVLPSDKITQSNNLTAMDTAVEKRMEENAIGVTPAVHSSVNQSDLSLAVKEPSPQPKETAQQQHPAQSAKKETVNEAVNAKETVVEDKQDATEHEVKVPPISFPNIFSPNGDGQNDFFVIKNIEQVDDTQLDIYTRNGAVIYSKRFYDNRWDGRGLPDGTYYYFFRFTYEGTQMMRTGSITIKR